MLKSEIVSESGAHSDSIDVQKGNRVRIKGTFRQHLPEKAKSCPNQGHIRTTLARKKWNRVRIKGIFGQHWHEKVESCPNQGHIRTTLARKSGIVSESRAYSDSIECSIKSGHR
jgi:hypothetical protein